MSCVSMGRGTNYVLLAGVSLSGLLFRTQMRIAFMTSNTTVSCRFRSLIKSLSLSFVSSVEDFETLCLSGKHVM